MSREQLARKARPLPPSEAEKITPSRKPSWLKIRPPGGTQYTEIKQLLRGLKLHTVCEEAQCPNVAECWAGGTATIMLGGDTCTRACRFCAVKTARTPEPLDPKEPENVASSLAQLGLTYVVLTSVDRDDLADQMSGHFAKTITAIKAHVPDMIVEALVPDFRGEVEAVQTIVKSELEVYAHNIETVERLQARVRDPRAGYEQSLATLQEAKRHANRRGHRLFTKSSIMVGLGETEDELTQAYRDLRSNGVDVLTLGQYLRPSPQHLPVEKFYSPEEFRALQKKAEQYGFLYVAAGPMVRSSYRAGEFFVEGVIRKNIQRPTPLEGEDHGIQSS